VINKKGYLKIKCLPIANKQAKIIVKSTGKIGGEVGKCFSINLLKSIAIKVNVF